MTAGETTNWLIPMIASLAAHVGILAVLALIVEPQPVQDQLIPNRG